MLNSSEFSSRVQLHFNDSESDGEEQAPSDFKRAAAKRQSIVPTKDWSFEQQLKFLRVFNSLPEELTADLTKKEIEKYFHVFDMFDHNGDGTVDKDELALVFISMGVPITPEVALKMIQKQVMHDDKAEALEFDLFLQTLIEEEKRAKEDSTFKVSSIVKAVQRVMKKKFRTFEEVQRHYEQKKKQSPHVIGFFSAGNRVAAMTDKQIKKEVQAMMDHAPKTASPYGQINMTSIVIKDSYAKSSHGPTKRRNSARGSLSAQGQLAEKDEEYASSSEDPSTPRRGVRFAIRRDSGSNSSLGTASPKDSSSVASGKSEPSSLGTSMASLNASVYETMSDASGLQQALNKAALISEKLPKSTRKAISEPVSRTHSTSPLAGTGAPRIKRFIHAPERVLVRRERLPEPGTARSVSLRAVASESYSDGNSKPGDFPAPDLPILQSASSPIQSLRSSSRESAQSSKRIVKRDELWQTLRTEQIRSSAMKARVRDAFQVYAP
eukprot:Colp12_sorted_trinity150504_noHs@22350